MPRFVSPTGPKSRRTFPVLVAASAGVFFGGLSTAFATDFPAGSVEDASLDVAQTHVILSQTLGGDPLQYGDATSGFANDIQGFLDTGTSGVLLSKETAAAFAQTYNPADPTQAPTAPQTYTDPVSKVTSTVTFHDIGVGGGQDFSVAAPLYVSSAPFSLDNDVEAGASPPALSEYTQTSGPIVAQISNADADPLLGPLDIIGMPMIDHHVAVFDPRPDYQLVDPTLGLTGEMKTALYTKGDPNIPTTNRHVQLTYASFARFTTTDPAGATGPTLSANPFIGPNPVKQFLNPGAPDPTPPVTIKLGNSTANGSFIFDTGAQESFISQAMAARLGVTYGKDASGNSTYGTDGATLFGPDGQQITGADLLSGDIGGIGGTIHVLGFYLDSLNLPTLEGDPLRFLHAPVLVVDVTVQDPATLKSFTLDGDLGLNYMITHVADPTDPANSIMAAFDAIVLDRSDPTSDTGLLGFQLSEGSLVPEPAGATVLLTLGCAALARRRRMPA